MHSKKYNRLIDEKSPYLLQHAENPVNWYPWGEEAFARANEEDKPIFLSIGYSTCHWCHVMAEESFEDPDIASLLNESFIAVKVDREERPDIDTIYMSACQLMTGGGGWPLTIVMTPDKTPFFAATYIPKEDRFGHTGMTRLIPALLDIWQNRKDEITNTANQLIQGLKQIQPQASDRTLEVAILDAAFQEFSQHFDEESGGFGDAPKFPTPHHFLFLLNYWKRNNNRRALSMVEETLRKMRLGGIYDHVGGGFHRYSTDKEWNAPHFEKMLYDQALMTLAYITAYQTTGNIDYADTARQVLDYVLRELTSPMGAFYSAEDADSEGIEGKFYLWRKEELLSLLGIEEGERFCEQFNIKEGKDSILIQQQGTGTKESQQKIKKSLDKLFKARKQRIHPFKDEKILADWNGLMIAAFARAGRALKEPRYIEAAKKAMEFIMSQMMDDENLLQHSFREEPSGIPGFLDDYAFMIWGMLELYEAGFDHRFLQQAIASTATLKKRFLDKEEGGYFFYGDQTEELIIRPKHIYDGALPSGNSVMALNLIRLARMTGDHHFEEEARRITRIFQSSVPRSPTSFSQFLLAFDFLEEPSYEIVVVGKKTDSATREVLDFLHSIYLPGSVILFKDTSQDHTPLANIAPFTTSMTSSGSLPSIYICRDFTCNLPVHTAESLKKFLI